MADVTEKACSRCGETQVCDQFYRDRAKRDGLGTWCRTCIRTYQRERRRTDRKYRERDKAACRAYRQANRESRRRQNADWAARNPERRREHIARSQRKRQDARRAAQALRRAKARAVHVEEVHPLVVLERDDGVCGICGSDVDPSDFHVDHVVPLAVGGEHSYANSQPAHPVCNMRKGAVVGVDR